MLCRYAFATIFTTSPSFAFPPESHKQPSSMCGLIAHTLKHRGKTTPPVSAQVTPCGKPDRAPSLKEATDSPVRRSSPGTREATTVRCASDQEEGLVSADVGIAGAGIGGDASASPKVCRSPPRVKRVTGEKAIMLPTLARHHHRSNAAGRKLRHRQEGVELSSSYLAAAIGCASIPSAMNGTGRAADQDHSDQHRSTPKTDSIANLFRLGLDLGQERFRGTNVV